MLAAVLSLALAAVAAGGVAQTDAEVKAVEVRFDGPEGCSSAKAFFGILRSRTHRVRAAKVDEPRTILEIQLSHLHGRVWGELRMVDDHGESHARRVLGASCDEVVQALSLTAALALDPSARLTLPPSNSDDEGTPTPDEPPPPPAVPKAPEPTVLEASAPPPPVVERPVPATELSAGAMALSLLSSTPSPGVWAGMRRNLVRPGIFNPSVGFALAYVRNDVLQSPNSARAALLAGAVSACPVRWRAGRVTAQPCAHGLAGWLSATGRQLTYTNTVDRFWLSAGATLRVDLYIGAGLSLDFEGGIGVPIIKRRYYATVQSNVVAESPTISPIVGVGLTYGR